MPIARARLNQGFGELFSLLFKVPLDQSSHCIQVEQFEHEFAQRYEYPHGIAVGRARTAFYLLLKHLNLPKGSKVVISALHIADFINMILLNDLEPVVVDLEPSSLLICKEDLEKKVDDQVRLILVTPLSGYMHDMEFFKRYCEDRNIYLVEDCSQAFAAEFDGQKAGTFGHASIFSLSLLKSVCTLQGGMLLSQDTDLLERIRQEVNGFSLESKPMLFLTVLKFLVLYCATHPVIFSFLTFPILKLVTGASQKFSQFQKQNKTVLRRKKMPENLLRRMRDCQAVLGRKDLKELEDRETRRQRIGETYYESLPQVHFLLPRRELRSKNGFWLFPVFAKNRSLLWNGLLQNGIDSSPLLLSHIPSEIAFQDLKFSAPNALKLKESILFIPIYPHLGSFHIQRVLNILGQLKLKSPALPSKID